MWLYRCYRDFVLEATGVCLKEKRDSDKLASSSAVPIEHASATQLKFDSDKGPPVIVAKSEEADKSYPMLEGRRRQRLPRIPGQLRGCLRAGDDKSDIVNSAEPLVGWFVPCRIGKERTINISIKTGETYSFDVTDCPTLDSDGQIKRSRVLRRAANLLQSTPHIFSAVPSISYAYSKLEQLWDDYRLEEEDPQVELLVRQARKLRPVLEELLVRPRAMLNTEHRMLRLQNVRRIDAKTTQWLSAQPGRNTAERAGARQRIKAPKRYETIATLENRVLRSFAALTLRETNRVLENSRLSSAQKTTLEAHYFRALRIVDMLRERNVPEAQPADRPNFTLRFDSRYNRIWRAWLDLRNGSSAVELEWMWQCRTYMELLGLRSLMKLHKLMQKSPQDGLLAHSPVLMSNCLLPQGCYLDNRGGLGAKFKLSLGEPKMSRLYDFRIVGSDDKLPLGAIAAVRTNTFDATIWWNVPEAEKGDVLSMGVEELPWQEESLWDTNIDKWIDRIMALT